MNKSWHFMKKRKVGCDTAEIMVQLTDDGLYAIADDDHYHGVLDREGSLDLARAVLEKLDPPAFAVGTHARVVDGAMCGCYGVVVGTIREDGYVLLRCRDGLLLQPSKFLREGL